MFKKLFGFLKKDDNKKENENKVEQEQEVQNDAEQELEKELDQELEKSNVDDINEEETQDFDNEDEVEEQAEKLELEKLEQERLEQERKAQEEVERLERERKAKEEADRKEQERKAKEEADRKEQERKAKEEADRKEQERKAKEEADRKEQERKAKEETDRKEQERKAKEEADRKEQERKAQEEAELKEQQRKLEEEAKKQEEKKAKEDSKKEKKGFFAKIREGLSKTKESFTAQLNNVFHMYATIDDDLLDEIEEILVTSDMGVELTMDIIDYIKDEVKKNNITDPTKVKDLIKDYLLDMLNNTKGIEEEGNQKIILVVGVNGVGKTTSIGKMAYRLKSNGESVIVAAADTFRAAAVEQLKEWCTRADVEIVASEHGSDPGSVVYDAIQAARARKSDVLICDTAGRLHNKVNLMNELSKIFKIVEKEYAHATREVLLVVDATTGQNGLIQAKMFSESCKIDGIILTKLDGTAKGGIVFPIVKELNVPIKYIGIGEKIDDLHEFDAKVFVDAIFE